jgi:hypothetical protein
LPFTYIDGNPLSNTVAALTGTGLGDAGIYQITTPNGYEEYSATGTFFPKSAGEAIKAIGVAAEIVGADVGFINRINLDRLSGLAIPLSYELTVTQKGIFIGLWDVLSEQNGKRFNWLAIQRSVDRISGGIRGRARTTETGKVGTFLTNTQNSVGPVYCVNSINNLYYQFIVREEDQGGPTIPASSADRLYVIPVINEVIAPARARPPSES